ncbi:MAG: RecX family transcriptional regulator [Saprospirales bacterium]|nr:MAG: RecX family transcriptional regulator [Saprospirales bacterium]
MVNNFYSVEELIKKLCAYCAYRDRSELEVVRKLRTLNASESQIPRVIQFLRDEKFLDQRRFVSSYVRGKFFQNKWGRHKIYQGLKAQKIPEKMIVRALNEIPSQEYLETMRELSQKKWESLPGLPRSEARKKVYQYLLSKGYESYHILEVLDD